MIKWPWDNSEFETDVLYLLNTINSKLDNLKKQGINIMNELANLKAQNDDLIANVNTMQTVEESVVTAINGLTATQADLISKLNDAIAAGDPAEIQKVSDSMSEQNQIMSETTQKLADAVANIPAV